MAAWSGGSHCELEQTVRSFAINDVAFNQQAIAKCPGKPIAMLLDNRLP
ncbi:hypothetical protein GCM10011317_16620 [Niveispirillum cyanobacteriorum]|nr:hypothetical protein GCM10011317_16620 [Niveispirillum cyanobacteriorum]